MSKTTKVIKVKRKHKAITHKNNLRFDKIFKANYKIILSVFAILSILVGSIIYDGIVNNLVGEVLKNQIQVFKTCNFLNILLFLLKTEVIYFLLALFIGTSYIGAPLIVAPICLKCIYLGYLGSYMYNEYELKGVLFCLLFVFPYAAITTTSLLFASNESIYMSKTCYNTVTNKNTADNISVKLYLLRYLILIIINGVCALFNSALIVLFINKINL